MKEALNGPKHVRSLKNRYLSLFIATVLILCSFGSYAQLPARDTTRDLKYIEAEGYSWRNGQFLVSLRLSNDTPRLALRDSGAVAYKGGNLWTWDGVFWNQKSSVTVVGGGSGVDSVIFNQPAQVCVFALHSGSPRCFELDKFIVHIGDNYDSTMWVGYNYQGIAVDSTDRNLILVFTRDGLDHTDTTVTRNGKQRRGIVFFATGITGGSVSDTTIRFPVLDSLNTPVVSPGVNDAWLIGTNPTGGSNPWVGHANNVARWNGSTYVYDTASVGDLLYRVSNNMVSKFNGTSWIRIGKLLFHPGGDAYGILQKLGPTDNQGLTLVTNNTDRLKISSSGTFTFVPGIGTGIRLTTLNPSGTLGTIAVPNSIKKYLTGYNTYGSLNDSVRAAISLTTTGIGGSATYNSSTGVFNIPNYTATLQSAFDADPSAEPHINALGHEFLLAGADDYIFSTNSSNPVGNGTMSIGPNYLSIGTQDTVDVSGIISHIGGFDNTDAGIYAQHIDDGNAISQQIIVKPKVVIISAGLGQQAKLVIQDAPVLSTTPSYILALDADTVKKYSYIPGGGPSISFSKEEFTSSTSTTVTVSHTYTSGSVDVFKNGILLQSSEYTEATGTTVTLTSARLSSDIIIVKYRY